MGCDYDISILTLLLICVYVLFQIVARLSSCVQPKGTRFAEFRTRDSNPISLQIDVAGWGAQRSPVQPAISQSALSQSAIRGNIDAFPRRSPVLHPLGSAPPPPRVGADPAGDGAPPWDAASDI